MSEIKRIAEQIRRSFEGEAWHGPSLMEWLEGLAAESASKKPIAGAHSIWEIVLHVAVTTEEVLARVQGEKRFLTPEQDWPPPNTAGGEEAWQADLERMRRANDELLKALAGVDDSRLDQPIVEGFSTTYVTLQGHAQHNTYHAGQIAVLRKGV